MSSSHERLRNALDNVTPKLEKVLAEKSLTSALGEAMQLRISQCGLATAALQQFLYDAEGIVSQRLITHSKRAPKLRDMTPQSHVILKTEEGIVIDPTYGQFMSHVGLTHKIARENELMHLYPARKIVSFPVVKTSQFVDKFAGHVFTVDQSGAIPVPIYEEPPDGALRGKNLDTMHAVYDNLWDLNEYDEFAIESQGQEIQAAANRITASLKKF